MKKVLIIIGILIVLGLGWYLFSGRGKHLEVSASPSPQVTASPKMVSWPVSDAPSRITKKPFGIYVSPGNSPISPEWFTGYHTGVDFETTSAEQNTDVPVYAICNGSIVLKETASGYGGVLVQRCMLNDESVTVIYGHIRLTSIAKNVNDELKSGEQFAVLGTGYSAETDGERKHLHLGIHLGPEINIQGYVQNPAELSQWLNAANYL